jgi:membrane protein
MTLRELFALLKETWRHWRDDKVSQLGAALSYYAVFSLAPLTVVAVAVASLVYGQRAAQGELYQQLERTIDPAFAKAIQESVQYVHRSGSGSRAALVGLAIMVLGAMGVFRQLQDSLNTIWGVKARADRGIVGMVKDRLLAFVMVLLVSVVLLVSLFFTTILETLDSWVDLSSVPGNVYFWKAVHWLVSFVLVTLLFAMTYKLLPDVRLAWKDVWIGALLTALLFLAGNYLIGLYLSNAGTASAYGAAGSLVIILVWVYYSSQILLFGAEFTQVYASKFGRPVVSERAEPQTGEDWERRKVLCRNHASESDEPRQEANVV